MNSIHLQQTLPQAFAGHNSMTSDAWHRSLILRKGKIYLIGVVSSTGKSPLYSYLYDYRNDYQGIANFDETNIKTYSMEQWIDLRRHLLSMLSRDLCISTEFTVIENVQLKNDLTGHEKKKEILLLPEKLGIPDKLNVKAGEFPFGQQQRVVLIRAFCQPLDFLLLNESISYLDDENSCVMGEIIVDEAGKQDTGVIATSIGKHIELPYKKVLQL